MSETNMKGDSPNKGLEYFYAAAGSSRSLRNKRLHFPRPNYFLLLIFLIFFSFCICQCCGSYVESHRHLHTPSSDTPSREVRSVSNPWTPTVRDKQLPSNSFVSHGILPFDFKAVEDVVARDVLNVFGKPSYTAPMQECETKAYPPSSSSRDELEEFVINLDLPPSERWTELVSAKKYQMVNLLKYLENFTHPLFNGNLVKTVDKYFPFLGASLPHPFREEIQAMANITGIPVGQMVLYNVFYEIFSVCTSIVLQMPDGTLAHGRNLDFGLFLGWNSKTNNWMTTDYLKPLIVTLRFERNGQLLFRSVNFAGYVGILTGVKPNGFTLTVNERFSIRGGFVGILEWMVGDRSGNWMGFLTRSVMENATDYNEAQKLLTRSELLAPAYFILGGNKRNEGSIITRDAKKFDILPLGFPDASPVQNFSWFLVQTNYDHWNSPPFWDDRLTPAIQCLQRSKQSDTPWKILYNVLSTRPVLNKLTTYTAMMQVSGWMEVYIRNCSDPCWPW